jgi:rhodanese-related sulfurtransferase
LPLALPTVVRTPRGTEIEPSSKEHFWPWVSKVKKVAREVSVDNLEVAVANGEFVIDVREDWEFQTGHVPNARHIPLNSLPDRLAEVPKQKTILVICQAGGRSMTAANYLEAQGYDVVSVTGGTGAWIQSGKAVSLEASK